MPGPAQLLLFPTDAEEQLLWSRCERLKRLPEKQQAVVRAYLRSLQAADRAPQKQDWVRAAESAGVGRTTFYETLQQHGSEIHAAVMEALQLVGKRAWLLGALSAELAMASLYSQLASGRPTSTLTAQELQLMMAAIELSGQGVRRGQAVASVQITDREGHQISVQAGVSSDDPDLEASLSYLRERQRRTLGLAAPSGETESVRRQLVAESAEALPEAAEARPERQEGEEAGKLTRMAGVAAAVALVLGAVVPETGRLAERPVVPAGGAAVQAVATGQAEAARGWVGVRGRARSPAAAGYVSCAGTGSEKIAEKNLARCSQGGLERPQQPVHTRTEAGSTPAPATIFWSGAVRGNVRGMTGTA